MNGTTRLIDKIAIDLVDSNADVVTLHIDIVENSLSVKWLRALNHLIKNDYHLEKNFCFLGFDNSARNKEYLLAQINQSIQAIDAAALGYQINDYFTVENTITAGPVGEQLPGGCLIHEKLNQLHRYFEDLQGVSGNMSQYYTKADAATKWHIRQLNLLCHEYESLVLSLRKAIHAPKWRRPSQLMCWLNAPRFTLDENDYELFGIDSINRKFGGVYVGVNKAVGKHHWEVFNDEGKNVDKLLTSTLRSQSEASGDFDIEWGNDPSEYQWQKDRLAEFRQWLIDNRFDPDDKSLTIGHPKIGQVDLTRSFSTTDYRNIWKSLGTHLNVSGIRTSDARAYYNYDWSDSDYIHQQIAKL